MGKEEGDNEGENETEIDFVLIRKCEGNHSTCISDSGYRYKENKGNCEKDMY